MTRANLNVQSYACLAYVPVDNTKWSIKYKVDVNYHLEYGAVKFFHILLASRYGHFTYKNAAKMKVY